jgi:hypothetical protein
VRAIGIVNHSARSTSGNVCSRPLFGGHSIFEDVACNGLDVEVAVDGERVDTLAATLTYFAQRLQAPDWSAAELLQEFSAGSVPGVRAWIHFALGDRQAPSSLQRE